MELKTEIMDLVNRERKAKAYSAALAEERRAKRIERNKRKTALSIIGGAIILTPVLYLCGLGFFIFM